MLKPACSAMVTSKTVEVVYDESLHMGLDVTKPVFRASDKARLKPVSLATETS